MWWYNRGLGLGLGSGLPFGLEPSAFRVRVSDEIVDLVLGLESSTFRVRVMVRIR